MSDKSQSTTDLPQYLSRVRMVSWFLCEIFVSCIARENRSLISPPAAAIVTLLAYDHLITIGDEVNFIWRSPGNLGKIFYVLARYGPYIEITLLALGRIPNLVSQHWCEITYTSATWLSFIGIALSELILFMRTWVLWNRSSRVGVPLLTFMGPPRDPTCDPYVPTAGREQTTIH
ncbi:hypothetical protein NLI96_g8706 [Meripilus lineatus]|uniref:DUF6533 domain-containing protein n=1 Tax=Meripilus lineatus TaxID=2056292 RepID=A0AAD5V1H0_9APHY|nr:hypothetical protein NLI96_g8706 [Physisporinus lineatus]